MAAARLPGLLLCMAALSWATSDDTAAATSQDHRCRSYQIEGGAEMKFCWPASGFTDLILFSGAVGLGVSSAFGMRDYETFQVVNQRSTDATPAGGTDLFHLVLGKGYAMGCIKFPTGWTSADVNLNGMETMLKGMRMFKKEHAVPTTYLVSVCSVAKLAVHAMEAHADEIDGAIAFVPMFASYTKINAVLTDLYCCFQHHYKNSLPAVEQVVQWSNSRIDKEFLAHPGDVTSPFAKSLAQAMASQPVQFESFTQCANLQPGSLGNNASNPDAVWQVKNFLAMYFLLSHALSTRGMGPSMPPTHTPFTVGNAKQQYQGPEPSQLNSQIRRMQTSQPVADFFASSEVTGKLQGPLVALRLDDGSHAALMAAFADYPWYKGLVEKAGKTDLLLEVGNTSPAGPTVQGMDQVAMLWMNAMIMLKKHKAAVPKSGNGNTQPQVEPQATHQNTTQLPAKAAIASSATSRSQALEALSGLRQATGDRQVPLQPPSAAEGNQHAQLKVQQDALASLSERMANVLHRVQKAEKSD